MTNFLFALALVAVVPNFCTAARVKTSAIINGNETENFHAPSEGVDWSSLSGAAGFQGGVCNSCYIWASLGCLEARLAIAYQKPVVRLSVQQAVDCARSEHMKEIGKSKLVYRSSRGCQTGFPKPVLQYAIDEGFMSAEAYPIAYNPDAGPEGSAERDKTNKQCLVDKNNLAPHAHPAYAKVREIINKGLKGSTDKWAYEVMAALADGPIAVGIDKTSYTVGLDKKVRGGAIATKGCRSKNNDHAVLLVGFGTEGDKSYWIIKNSWGEKWGHNGYFKVPRAENFCGVENTAAFIVFPKGGN